MHRRSIYCRCFLHDVGHVYFLFILYSRSISLSFAAWLVLLSCLCPQVRVQAWHASWTDQYRHHWWSGAGLKGLRTFEAFGSNWQNVLCFASIYIHYRFLSYLAGQGLLEATGFRIFDRGRLSNPSDVGVLHLEQCLHSGSSESYLEQGSLFQVLLCSALHHRDHGGLVPAPLQLEKVRTLVCSTEWKYAKAAVVNSRYGACNCINYLLHYLGCWYWYFERNAKSWTWNDVIGRKEMRSM